jgi:prepilin-type N-terminal cleavage/methylation domain-containing protein
MISKIASARNQKGFTLIELLIVIAIIGILAAIAIPQFSAYKRRAYDSDAKANLHNLFLACKAYWGDNVGTDACDIATMTSTTYGYNQSTNVGITINTADELNYSSTAQHNSSTQQYTLNSAGNISSP